MKFDRIIERYESTYAVFNMETPEERDFFKNIHSYVSFEAPSDVLRTFINSLVPAFWISNSDINILVHCSSNFKFLDSSKSKPAIYLLLTDLFKKNVLSDDLGDQVEKGVIEFKKLKS